MYIVCMTFVAKGQESVSEVGAWGGGDPENDGWQREPLILWGIRIVHCG